MRLRRIECFIGKRLFLRQLRGLSFADLFFVLSSLPLIVVSHPLWNSANTPSGVCTWIVMLATFFRHLSLWIEMHIAVSSLLQAFKVDAARGLRCSFFFIWAPGLLFTLVSTLENPWTYNYKERVCVPGDWFHYSADSLTSADLALAMCICSTSYVASICRGWKRWPGSVQRRVSRRAEIYIANALVTYVLAFACFTNRALFKSRFFLTVAMTLELLGGALNTAAYAWQSRYGAALGGDTSAMRADLASSVVRPSFHVEFTERVPGNQRGQGEEGEV